MKTARVQQDRAGVADENIRYLRRYLLQTSGNEYSTEKERHLRDVEKEREALVCNSAKSNQVRGPFPVSPQPSNLLLSLSLFAACPLSSSLSLFYPNQPPAPSLPPITPSLTTSLPFTLSFFLSFFLCRFT